MVKLILLFTKILLLTVVSGVVFCLKRISGVVKLDENQYKGIIMENNNKCCIGILK